MPYNSEQQEAILHKDGPALVLAGPGSGKTAVITGRIRTLISFYQIPASHILVLSFTRAASRETEDRFREQFPGEAPVCFGTIHAVFYRLLRISRPGAVCSVLPSALRREWIREMLLERTGGADLPPERLRQTEDLLTAGPGKAGESGFLSPEEEKELREEYDRRKKQAGLLDFEDILRECLTLFDTDPEVLSVWQRRFRYILIDEYQDTSPLQLRLLKRLAGKAANLFAVGDDDQSIYGFRGADSGLMLRFPQDFPGAKLYRLTECYRCSPEILSAAGSLIGRNRNRYAKSLRSCAPSGPLPVLAGFGESGAELRALTARLREEWKRNGKDGSLAVLCRSRLSLRRVAAALAGAGLPFSGGEGPEGDHAHWAAADLFAYLRLGRGSKKREDYLRILSRPPRYLSRQLFREEEIDRAGLLSLLWERPQTARNLTEFFRHLDRLKGMRPYAAVEYIRREIGYDGYLKSYAENRGLSAAPFLELLDRLQEESAAFASSEEWERAREALLAGKKDRAEESDGICLLTMHGAKGLEFDRVFLPFLNEEEIPGARAEKEAQREEERRLLYVAMTRARRVLYMSCTVKKRGGRSRPSRFLKEIRGIRITEGPDPR